MVKWGVGPYVLVGAWNDVCFVRSALVGGWLIVARARASCVFRVSMPSVRARMERDDHAVSSVLGMV